MAKKITATNILKSGLRTAQQIWPYIAALAGLMLLIAIPSFLPDELAVLSCLFLPLVLIGLLITPVIVRRAALAVLRGKQLPFREVLEGISKAVWRTLGANIVIGMLGSIILGVVFLAVGLPLLVVLRNLAAWILIAAFLVLTAPLTLIYYAYIELVNTAIVSGKPVSEAFAQTNALVRDHYNLLIKVTLSALLPYYAFVYLGSFGLALSTRQSMMANNPVFWLWQALALAVFGIVQVVFVAAYHQLKPIQRTVKRANSSTTKARPARVSSSKVRRNS